MQGEIQSGTVTYFCKSRGHGFIQPTDNSEEKLFVHVSDVESDLVPLKGDQVNWFNVKTTGFFSLKLKSTQNNSTIGLTSL